MNFRLMSSALFSLSFFLSLPSAGQSSQTPVGQTGTSFSTEGQQLVSVAQARADAFASGDCPKWASLVDIDFRDIESKGITTRKDALEECQEAARAIPDHKIERLVSDFHFQFAGNLAFVDYLYEFKEHFGEISLNDTARQLDIYEKRQGKWVALLSASATVIPDPPVAKVDSARLNDFVGEYAWVGSHNVETVTRKGDRLYVQGKWEDSPTELLPQTTDTFFVRGGGVSPQARVRFVRDKVGRVIGERVYSPADGQGYDAKKSK